MIGYFGLLLFMIGDGVEAGFLSPMLIDLHFTTSQVAIVFTGYGITAALASWLSGALSDIFGPKKVMWAGYLIWLAFEVPFLTLGIAHANYFAYRGRVMRCAGLAIHCSPTGFWCGSRR